MIKLQEIRSEIWLNCYYKFNRETHDHEFSVKEADRVIKDFDSRFPGDPTILIPTNEKPVMLNGGKQLSILEAELALESASEIIERTGLATEDSDKLEVDALNWIHKYYVDTTC